MAERSPTHDLDDDEPDDFGRLQMLGVILRLVGGLLDYLDALAAARRPSREERCWRAALDELRRFLVKKLRHVNG